eukprot:jgi/Mesen1/241/ME1142627C07627
MASNSNKMALVLLAVLSLTALAAGEMVPATLQANSRKLLATRISVVSLSSRLDATGVRGLGLLPGGTLALLGAGLGADASVTLTIKDGIGATLAVDIRLSGILASLGTVVDPLAKDVAVKLVLLKAAAASVGNIAVVFNDLTIVKVSKNSGVYRITASIDLDLKVARAIQANPSLFALQLAVIPTLSGSLGTGGLPGLLAGTSDPGSTAGLGGVVGGVTGAVGGVVGGVTGAGATGGVGGVVGTVTSVVSSVFFLIRGPLAAVPA